MTTFLDNSKLFSSSLEHANALNEVAAIAVEQCANVQAGERMLVVTDNVSDPQLAGLVAAAGRRRGAEVVTIDFPHADTIHDIPERVQQAIAASDVVIPLCKSRILYSNAIREVSDHGRLLYMADVPTDFFLRPVVRDTDYTELARFAEAFGTILNADGELSVSAPAGTKATMQMRADRGQSISSCRSHKKGDHDYLPGGAWFGCPIEESVNGIFVIDSSMEPGVLGGVVDEPIALTFVDGVLVSVEGGSQADEFTAWLDECDDQIRGVSHNGGGFNRMASRTGNLMEDERILGSFNIAGGNNQSGWPGTNSSSFHWDAMMLNASYSLAGVQICEAGNFVHPLLSEKSSS